MRIFHTYSNFLPEDPETRRRIATAQDSWDREYKRSGIWLKCPQESGCPRSFDGVPFVRDIISNGVGKAVAWNRAKLFPKDIVAISNTDVSFITGLTDHVLCGTNSHGAVYCHRWDFSKSQFPTGPVEQPRLRTARWYPGSDFFAFTVEWAEEHLSIFPDMLLAREFWDLAMRLLIRRGGGIEIHQGIYHEKHASFWERPGVREQNPGNAHNKKLLMEWISKYGGDWDDWSKQPIFK